jgi:TRAP transporter 4TM/12TM fusion protein
MTFQFLKKYLLPWLAFCFALFHVYYNIFAPISDLWFAAIHFGGFAALCALNFHKQDGPITWFNSLLALLAISVPVYLILFESPLFERETSYILLDYIFAVIAIVLAIEFTRRTTGWAMPTLAIVSLGYILLFGRYIPGEFYFPGLRLETVFYRIMFTDEGMFGGIASISATYVFMFVLFGAFLLRSGAGEFIIKLANCVAGRFTGGAGMVAVASSGLMGSVSGSAVANTVSIGVITIPVMNRSGFKPQFSAGVVAAASTGGPLMPPIMGAGAFVIASNTGIPYLTIIALSVLPALLYFLTVAYFVRIEAKRLGITADNTDAAPVGTVLKEGWPFIIPLAVLIGLMIVGYTPILASAVSIIAVIATSWLSATPMNAKACFEATNDAVKTVVPIALLLVAVGIVVDVLLITGFGNILAVKIVEWAQGSLVITLVLIAVASLILGMGLPVTASYIVLATLSAPALYELISFAQLYEAIQTAIQAGTLPSSIQTTINLFGGDVAVALREMPIEMKQSIRADMLDPGLLTGMLLSAHLIIFWLSQDSNVTPPVCLAAFAAAGVAGTRPMATGFTAWKLSKGLYLVPLLLAYSPLVTGDWLERLEEFFWASLGLYALAGLLHWHLDRPLNLINAAALIASAVLLTWAPFPLYCHILGVILLVAVIFWQKRELSTLASLTSE